MRYMSATAFLLWSSIWLSRPALSIKCFECEGRLDTKCENATTEIECKPTGQRVYDSCYTVTRIMDYPLLGRRVEQIKNCSVLAHCGFLESMLCHNRHGFVNSCSIECCTENLCNKKTLQLTQSTVTPVTRVTYSSSITRANFTRVLTSHVTLTRAPKLTTSIDVSPSSISRNTERTKSDMRTSWTSVKSQFVLFSSVLPTTKPVAVEVQLVCASANRFFIQLSVLLLVAFLGLGFNICGRL